MKVEFETEGMWPIGKVLMSCGHYELCLEDIPNAKTVVVTEDVLPQVPILKENERAILVVGHEGVPEWKVRDTSAKTAAMTSGGFSLATLIAVVMIVKKIIKEWEKKS